VTESALHKAAAPPPPTSRDFVPWRFSDAGRRSARIASSSRRPKTCTNWDLGVPEREVRFASINGHRQLAAARQIVPNI